MKLKPYKIKLLTFYATSTLQSSRLISGTVWQKIISVNIQFSLHCSQVTVKVWMVSQPRNSPQSPTQCCARLYLNLLHSHAFDSHLTRLELHVLLKKKKKEKKNPSFQQLYLQIRLALKKEGIVTSVNSTLTIYFASNDVPECIISLDAEKHLSM